MKLTSKQLRVIIKEELQNVLDEGIYDMMSTRLGDDTGADEKRRDREREAAMAADKKRREREDAEHDKRVANIDRRDPEEIRKEKERKRKEREEEEARVQNRSLVVRRLNRITGDQIIDAQIPKNMAKGQLGMGHPFESPIDLKDRLELMGFDSKVASRLQQKIRDAITAEIQENGFVPWASQFDGEWNRGKQKFEFGTQSSDKFYDYIKNLAFSVGKASGLNRPMLKRLGSFFTGKGFKE